MVNVERVGSMLKDVRLWANTSFKRMQARLLRQLELPRLEDSKENLYACRIMLHYNNDYDLDDDDDNNDNNKTVCW